MFNSLLNAGNVGIDSLILDVFIILGIVVAGALVVYFSWEAVTSVIARNKKNGPAEKLNLDVLDQKENPAVSNFQLDAEPVKEEVKEEVIEPVETVEEAVLEDVDSAKAEEEKAEMEAEMSEEERENAERRAYLEARRQELLKRMQAEMEEEPAEENEEVEEETTETVEETQESEAEGIVVEESTENVDALADERKALAAEKERYETMVKELEEAKRALAAQEPKSVVETVVVNNKLAGLSLEELKDKLANAEDRLKSTEKEFKQCKKEYIPLRKVWTTHEKDEKKLRRKEALVARQKVLLYGVNNYADIDEEKAKKLAEDLDLLDGLKLSVQHCEEVMKNNEERYPLLEKMYNVLKLRDEELKNDIESYRAEIARLEKEQTQLNSESEQN